MNKLNLSGEAGPPRALQVEITSHCNLKCVMCPLTLGATMSGISPGHMQDAIWGQVVEAARAVGRVNLTGIGENATNPKFTAMLDELDALGIRTSFTTNGTGMLPRIVARIARLKHLDHVNVSIDSPDPDLYFRIRGGSFQKAWRGLETLAAELPSRVDLTVSSIAMNNNIESLVAMPGLLHSIGVKTYLVQGLHDRTMELFDDDFRLNPKGPESAQAIHERCERLGITLRSGIEHEAGDLPSPSSTPAEEGFSTRRTRQCTAPWETPFVDRDGRVFPCCHGDSTSVLGNAADGPIMEIWNAEKFRRFRLDLIGGESIPSICRKCRVAGIGPHPLRYAGEIVARKSRLKGSRRLKLVVRNNGVEPWTTTTPLAIGVTGDRHTPLHLDSWASKNRVAYMKEAVVKPGECATFEFSLRQTAFPVEESFGLVVESVVWLSGITMTLPRPQRILRRDSAAKFIGPHYLARRWDGIRRRALWVHDRFMAK